MDMVTVKISKILQHHSFLWLLVVINFIGSIYGYYWYHNQLSITPLFLWIFVPDSPFSCTLFTLAMLGLIYTRRVGLFTLIACLAMIKYGIWAVVINYTYWQIAGTFTLENWLLSLSHLGMAIEGIIYLVGIQISWRGILVPTLLTYLWDIMDYVVDLHPFLFDPRQVQIAQLWAVGLSTGLVMWLLIQRWLGPVYRISNDE